MIQCAWCSETFEPTTNSQIYCGVVCREQATKQRIAEQYKQKRRIRKKPKLCAGGCGTILSVYNDADYCTYCMFNKKQFKKLVKTIKDIANGKISEC